MHKHTPPMANLQADGCLSVELWGFYSKDDMQWMSPAHSMDFFSQIQIQAFKNLKDICNSWRGLVIVFFYTRSRFQTIYRLHLERLRGYIFSMSWAGFSPLEDILVETPGVCHVRTTSADRCVWWWRLCCVNGAKYHNTLLSTVTSI